MLSIVTCIKQVPDTQRAVFDPATGALVRSMTGNIMNPDDLHALETALTLRDACGGSITAVSMGPPQAADVLREAYAFGVDRCVLITDQRFAGSDSIVTGRILSRAITRLGAFDVVVTGFEAIDGNTSHVSFQLSEYLSMPLITQIHSIQVAGGHAVIERLYGHEFQKIRVSLPICIAAGRGSNRVRIPSLADINTCEEREIAVLTMDDIGGSEDEYGVAGSPTVVIETETFSHVRGREQLDGTVQEKADLLVQRMKKHNILRY
jgi:electron transfer flavoprotein alpha/beta subunit